MRIIRVNMAQLDIAKYPDNIETLALGSCIGVVLYDHASKIGGISHAMLPCINDAKINSRDNHSKFVDTSILLLIKKMQKDGACINFLKAKLAGGANMFPEIIRKESLHIGERNVEAAKEMLHKLRIPIIAEDTGGTFGRTIVLNTNNGMLKVTSISLGTKEI